MVISRVIIRVAPFRALITLRITYLRSPVPLQVEGFGVGKFVVDGFSVHDLGRQGGWGSG